MNLKNSSFILLFFTLVSCHQQEITDSYLIDLEEFEVLSKLKTTKIIDFRKHKEYQKGHIKNAINIWRTAIVDSSFPYDGMKASRAQLEELFSRLGIQSDDTLVVYDDNGLCEAARFWWVLQFYNFKNVKLLNGGLTTLQNAGKSFTKEETRYATSMFNFKKGTNPSFIATKEQIKKAITNASVILDTRTTTEFTGKQLKKGAFQAGKISGSILIDWANAINYNGDKKIKSTTALTKIYGKLLQNKNDTLYVYCHSGVRSAHTTFILTQLLNYKHVLNYDGSWTEWSYYNDLSLKNND